ncbi:MAG: caspase family protein, partial [Alphaproteobacteria bacterium]|nr:caspase family protein [Alphaproteobacteria bacterium]
GRDMAGNASPTQPTIGEAVIQTNDYVGCPDRNCKELPGTKKDLDAWKKTLESLHFYVRPYHNLTKEETIRLLKKVSALDMSAASGDVKQHLVFVYSGHGGRAALSAKTVRACARRTCVSPSWSTAVERVSQSCSSLTPVAGGRRTRARCFLVQEVCRRAVRS